MSDRGPTLTALQLHVADADPVHDEVRIEIVTHHDKHFYVRTTLAGALRLAAELLAAAGGDS
jgi:hypothetical protein